MPVLHGAVMETLRMYPIAVAAMRNATRDFEFAGHLVEKDEPLFIAITVSHFLEQFYSIPTKFDITRFAPPRNEHKQAGAFAPFSLGDHTCLGVTIAEVQIALTMATLFHRLQMELAPSDYQMRMKVAPRRAPS
jgi:cytochrome P450